MNILICGASGFLGRHLCAALEAAGHRCIRGVRRPRHVDDRAVDYRRDVTPQQWLPLLQDVDVVINAVGVLRDTAAQPMQQLLAEAPRALFQAAAQAGVSRVVNISALGIESSLQTPYFRWRRDAEAALMALPPPTRWLNLRPSVVYGEDGASARMFRLLARLPLHMLPAGGRQELQPVHVDDLCAAVLRWLQDADAPNLSVNAAGTPTTMRGMLDSYRRQLGHGAAWHLPVPLWMVATGARLGDFIPASPLCSDTLLMLNAGNTGDNRAFAQLLGREPRSFDTFIAPEGAVA